MAIKKQTVFPRKESPPVTKCCLDEVRTNRIRRSWFVTLMGGGMLLMAAGAGGMLVASLPPKHPHVTRVTAPPPSTALAIAAPFHAPIVAPEPTVREKIDMLLEKVALDRERGPEGAVAARGALEAAVTLARGTLHPKDVRGHKLDALLRAHDLFTRAGKADSVDTLTDRLVELIHDCVRG